MFLFSPDPNKHPLITQLRALPDTMTLVDFTSKVSEIIKRKTTSSILDDISQSILPRGNAPLSIRTVRHMIYQHPVIQDQLKKDGKEVVLNHRAQIQILLAKRLSHVRTGIDIRSKILGKDNGQLEYLLIQPDAFLRSDLTSFSRSDGGVNIERPASIPANSKPYHRIPLLSRDPNRMALEHQVDSLPLTSPGDAQEAIETLLSALFNIPSNSPICDEIVTKIMEHHQPVRL